MEFLADFSKVVRQTFKHSSMRLVTLDQEIDFLSAYLRLETMRFPELFDCELSLKGENTHGNMRIPPMLVQPYVENAIRHGFKRVDRKGHLMVLFESQEHEILKITIEDDGVGRKQALQYSQPHPQDNQVHSTQITENRIALLNSSDNPGRYRVVITDLVQGAIPAGLRVEIFIPVE
jgi:LytS/YehU family sensor histidine kinase